MIDVKSLRIGNWLLSPYLESYQVDQIKKDSLNQYPHWLTGSEPISLTDDLFEKMGFLYDVIHDSCHKKINGYSEIFFRKRDGGYYLANSLPGGYEQFKGSKTFKFVHEVQNFYFSVYGEDLKFTP